MRESSYPQTRKAALLSPGSILEIDGERVYARNVVTWPGSSSVVVPVSSLSSEAGHPYGEGSRPELKLQASDEVTIYGHCHCPECNAYVNRPGRCFRCRGESMREGF